MGKRSREDSSASSSPTTPSFTITESGPSSPASVDAPVHSSKYLQVSEERSRSAGVMKCSLPPHRDTLAFATFEEFEIHYSKDHANRCSECGKNFPSEHFLGLHIGENHDPMNEARKARGEKTYKCFVEDCDKICSIPQRRRMHLIDKHMFPKNYDFFIVNSGIDRRSSMLRPRHRQASSASSRALLRDRQGSISQKHVTTLEHSHGETQMDLERPLPLVPAAEDLNATIPKHHSQTSYSTDVDMERLASNMSTLRFVPSSVRFGRGGRRGGFSRS